MARSSSAPARWSRSDVSRPKVCQARPTQQRMIECAHAVMQAAAPADADLRAICRGA